MKKLSAVQHLTAPIVGRHDVSFVGVPACLFRLFGHPSPARLLRPAVSCVAEYHQHPTGGTTAESVVEYYSLQSGVGRSGSTGPSLVTGKLWHSRQPGICPICQRVFSNKFNLKQHIINIHTAGGGIECAECHKMCKNKWYLRRHQVTHHGAPLRRGRVDGGPCSPHTMPRHLHSISPQ